MSSLILLTSLRDVATYAIFQLNQDYISQNLCENRFKPEVMCSGKCVLNKSLAQNHEQKEGKQTIPQQEERSVFVLPNIEIKLKSYSFLIVKKDSIAYCTAFYAFEFLDDVFHPPSVFS
jgi:hypothetical protein